MSEDSSPLSPISGSLADDDDDLTSDIDIGSDGAADTLRTWRRGMQLDPDLTLPEWVDQHCWLSSHASANGYCRPWR